MATRYIVADVMDALATLGDETVDCVVTSPPYWGLRSYLPHGHEHKSREIGTEPTLRDHIAVLVAVFREVRRVLKPAGTLWLNYGDMYAGSWGAQSRGDYTEGALTGSTMSRQKIAAAQKNTKTSSIKRTGLKAKNACLAPHRLAIALQDDGWLVRSDIVWHKPNAMPSSVTDRPTAAKEYVFLLAKSDRYYYDADAIAEPRTSDEDANGFRGGSYVGGAPGKRATTGNKRVRRKNETTGDRQTVGFNDRSEQTEAAGDTRTTRNARDVWTIATEAFSQAHYATFPQELARRCISAGCPPGGTVLDPFGGSGTVGLVADQLQRHAILIDIDGRNYAFAVDRLMGDAPLLAEMENG